MNIRLCLEGCRLNSGTCEQGSKPESSLEQLKQFIVCLLPAIVLSAYSLTFDSLSGQTHLAASVICS